MAKSDINVHIGTTYDGEGFTKLNNALKRTGGEARKATSIISGVAGSLGSIDAGANKVVRTMGNLAGGFASLGVAGVVLGGITTAFQMMKEHVEKARKAVLEMRDAIKDNLLAAMGNAEAKSKVIASNFAKTADKINKAYANQGQRDNAAVAGKIASTRAYYINGRKGMTDEHQITLSKAEEQREIGRIQADAARDKAQQNVAKTKALLMNKMEEEGAAKKALEEAKRNAENVKGGVASYVTSRDYYQGKIDDARKRKAEAQAKGQMTSDIDKEIAKATSDLQKLNETQKADAERLAKAEQLLASAQERLANTTYQREQLEESFKTVVDENIYAQKTHETALMALNEALKEQKEQVKKSIEAEKKAAKEKAEKESKDSMRKGLQSQLKGAEEVKSKYIDARRPELQKMIDKANEWQNKVNAAGVGGVDGGYSPSDYARNARDEERQGRTALGSRIKNIDAARGQLDAIKDRMSHGRATEADKRAVAQLNEYLSLQSGNLSAEERAAAEREFGNLKGRIFDKHGNLKRGASARDKERYKDLNGILNPQNPVKDSNKAQQDYKAELERQTQTIKDIKEKLENLGV